MTKEEHRQRHVKLHASLDELFADWIKQNPNLSTYINAPIIDLINWAHRQANEPDHDSDSTD